MGNYKLEYGNGKWLTGVGGSVMTATDLDTGIVEPILLKNGRGSEKTAIDKNGKLYTVKPYENAVTYIDGVAKHNTEPLAENRFTYSEDFSHSSWLPVGLSFSSTTEENPKGDNGSYNVIESNLNELHRFRALSGSSSTYFSQSLYVKYTGSQQFIQITGSIGITEYVNFDILNKTFNAFGNSTAKITSLDNGWIRIESYLITDISVEYTFVSGLSAPRQEVYQGTGKSLLLWGAQLEENIIATSYIPTNGATATRLADTGIFTPDISKYINSEEGVFFVDIESIEDNGIAKEISISDGSDLNRLTIGTYNVLGNLRCECKMNNTAFYSVFTNISLSGRIKAALSFSSTDGMSFWVNGNEVNSSSTLNPFTEGLLKSVFFDRGSSSGSFLYGDVNEVSVFTRKLTDQELTDLTTI